MKYKTITYQRVLNLGNYENKKLELTAELEDGEDVNQSIFNLKEVVESSIQKELLTKMEEEVKFQQKAIENLKAEKFDLRADLKELEIQIEEYKSKLPVPDDLDDDKPF